MTETVLAKVVRAPGILARRAERNAGAAVYRRYFDRAHSHSAIDQSAIRASLAGADHITFLCMGNICRSPFAEEYARAKLPGSLEVTSAGLSPFEGIGSPPTAIEAAAEYGVDLSTNESIRATDALMIETDLVFVMDHANYYLVRTRHPQAIDRVAYLGAMFDHREDVTIEDPHGAPFEQFERTYATIAAAIDRLDAH